MTHGKVNAEDLSPLVLAYIGDSVFELLVRESLIAKGNLNLNTLHGESVQRVCCLAQSRSIDKLINLLDDEETSVYKRGRNAHVSHIPKGATPGQYHRATGLETLFGYLYLKGRVLRIEELFDAIDKGE